MSQNQNLCCWAGAGTPEQVKPLVRLSPAQEARGGDAGEIGEGTDRNAACALASWEDQGACARP